MDKVEIKQRHEITKMEIAGKVVAKVHVAMKEAIKPGVTTKQLDQIAFDVIAANDCKPSFLGYGGFPGSICASVNDVIVHGIPDDTPLEEGDVISVDVGACFKGYHGDSAWTYVVGDAPVKPEIQNLLKVTEDALMAGIAVAKDGVHLGDVCHAIGEHVRKHKMGIPQSYAGHGIGRNLHMDPMVPNEGVPGTGIILKEGMTIAIEPMAHLGGDDTMVDDDEWTVRTVDKSYAAHFEHTVLIEKDGARILTTMGEDK